MSDLESPGSSRLSVTDTKENSDVGVEEEEQLSCCALGQDVSEDSVATSCGVSVQNASLEEVLEEYKTSLRRRFESVTEETDNTGSGTLPNRIYTELYITEGQNEDVHNQHEVMQLETASKMEALDDITVRCHDTFKALPDQQRPIRVVLTNSVADQRRAMPQSIYLEKCSQFLAFEVVFQMPQSIYLEKCSQFLAFEVVFQMPQSIFLEKCSQVLVLERTSAEMGRFEPSTDCGVLEMTVSERDLPIR
uniref:uncharacterized protein LOC112433639 n=1 Tax=Maylandia zebra TaxID=106582 RepID=UPI000D2F68FB